jgi:hypothetical protein
MVLFVFQATKARKNTDDRNFTNIIKKESKETRQCPVFWPNKETRTTTATSNREFSFLYA